MNNFSTKSIDFLEKYAGAVLRYGMSAVILWFSIQLFLHNGSYIAYVPDSVVSFTHISSGTLVFFNASFELVFGIALVFGWFTRITSLLLALHLFDIMWTVGYGEIGVRDFGLAIGTLVVFMNGPDILCMQTRKLIVEDSVNLDRLNLAYTSSPVMTRNNSASMVSFADTKTPVTTPERISWQELQQLNSDSKPTRRISGIDGIKLI